MMTVITCNGVSVEIPSSLITAPTASAVVSENGQLITTLAVTFVGEITLKHTALDTGKISLG